MKSSVCWLLQEILATMATMALAHTRQIEEACKAQNRDMMAQRDAAQLAAQCAEAELQKLKKRLAAAELAAQCAEAEVQKMKKKLAAAQSPAEHVEVEMQQMKSTPGAAKVWSSIAPHSPLVRQPFWWRTLLVESSVVLCSKPSCCIAASNGWSSSLLSPVLLDFDIQVIPSLYFTYTPCELRT